MMKTEGRVEFTTQLTTRALAFYKCQCARCDLSQAIVQLELHHVCEDPDKRGSRRLSNAIPLCPNHHTPIQRSNYLTRPDLTGAMSPDSLRLSGFDYLLQGAYEKSYACFRLAAYFFEQRNGKFSYAADCAIECIAALRAIQGRCDANALLGDAIRNAARVVSCLRDGCAAVWKAQFFRQLELALFDYREFDLAAECCKRARLLFKAPIPSDAMHPEDMELLKANAARAHLLAGDRIDSELLGDFAAAKKTLQGYDDWRGYCTNLDVESCIERAQNGPAKKARDLVEEALYYRERIFNPWVVAELRYREGVLRMSQDRQKKRAKEALSDALRIFRDYQITPEPRRDKVERGPGEALRSLGIADATLIEPRRKFPIGQNDIRRLVNMVEGRSR